MKLSTQISSPDSIEMYFTSSHRFCRSLYETEIYGHLDYEAGRLQVLVTAFSSKLMKDEIGDRRMCHWQNFSGSYISITRVGDVPEIVMNMRLHKLVSKVTDLHAFPWLGVGVSD